MAQTLEQSYETVSLADLVTHPDNPRQGDVGMIHESIAENGFYGALVVQKSSMRILAGNHRYLAAKAVGLVELPALLVDVDDELAARIMLVDNRSNDLASYDESALAGLLLSMDDLVGTGYSLEDLEALQHKLNAPLKLDDGDGASELGDGTLAVIVTCEDEGQQRDLIERFEGEGLLCRALMM